MAVTAIQSARVFDGDRVLDGATVLIDGTVIVGVGAEERVPDGASVVDAAGCTLLPGLIDAHVHTSTPSLALALSFGVTTELEMQGMRTRPNRGEISENDAVADVRSSGFGITPPGGHPDELFPDDFRPGPPPGAGGSGGGPRGGPVKPLCTTPEEAVAAVSRLVESGSDYIKFMVDDGSVEGHPGIPMLDQATLDAGVAHAKRLGMLTIAHALTIDATRMAIQAGIDGLAHLFMDRPHTDEIIQVITDSGAFVVPCVVLDASMIGITGDDLADDPRVASRLDGAWMETLRGCLGHYPQGSIDDVLASVKALRDAGVDLLCGTDVSIPVPFMGGLAHGASVHHELQYLVRAGLTPLEALRAATSTPSRRFGLTDRGRIAPGLRADLLLVEGDPLSEISDTLNTVGVWRRGARLAG